MGFDFAQPERVGLNIAEKHHSHLHITFPNPFTLSEVEGQARRMGFDFPRT